AARRRRRQAPGPWGGTPVAARARRRGGRGAGPGSPGVASGRPSWAAAVDCAVHDPPSGAAAQGGGARYVLALSIRTPAPTAKTRLGSHAATTGGRLPVAPAAPAILKSMR